MIPVLHQQFFTIYVKKFIHELIIILHLHTFMSATPIRTLLKRPLNHYTWIQPRIQSFYFFSLKSLYSPCPHSLLWCVQERMFYREKSNNPLVEFSIEHETKQYLLACPSMSQYFSLFSTEIRCDIVFAAVRTRLIPISSLNVVTF